MLVRRFLANGHLPQMSRQSRLLANDKGDNEVKPGAVHRWTDIYFTDEGNPGKPKLGDRLMKAVRPVIVSNGFSYLQIRYVESQNTSGRVKDGNKGFLLLRR